MNRRMENSGKVSLLKHCLLASPEKYLNLFAFNVSNDDVFLSRTLTLSFFHRYSFDHFFLYISINTVNTYIHTLKKNCETLNQPTIEARLTGLNRVVMHWIYGDILYIGIHCVYDMWHTMCKFIQHTYGQYWMDINEYDNSKNIYNQLSNTLTALSTATDVTTERYQTLCLSYVFGIDKYKCVMQWMQATLALDGIPTWWTNLAI